MTLDEWLERRGRGAIHKLHLDSGVSLPVIARARAGHASLANAIKLHEQVDRRVPIASMTAEAVPASLGQSRRRSRAQVA